MISARKKVSIKGMILYREIREQPFDMVQSPKWTENRL